MKGFGIYVKNDLLEAKHIESMGTAVWLYMWFLDKMTSIGEDGIGKVLGGKPVIFEEVQQALGITERTYRRWIATLKKSGYINITRTPRGLSVSVNKAAKIFGKRSDAPKTAHQRSAENGTSDRPKTAHRLAKNGTSNKDNTVDNTVRLSPYGERRQAAKVQSLEIDRVIKAFELMDYTLPSPTKQRRRELSHRDQCLSHFQATLRLKYGFQVVLDGVGLEHMLTSKNTMLYFELSNI